MSSAPNNIPSDMTPFVPVLTHPSSNSFPPTNPNENSSSASGSTSVPMTPPPSYDEAMLWAQLKVPNSRPGQNTTPSTYIPLRNANQSPWGTASSTPRQAFNTMAPPQPQPVSSEDTNCKSCVNCFYVVLFIIACIIVCIMKYSNRR